MKNLLSLFTFLFLTLHTSAFAVNIGEKAPEFKLTDTQGNEHSLSSFAGKYVVLEWTNPDCPFVKKHYDSGNMQEIQNYVKSKDVVWLAVNSSAEGKQGYYSPEEWNQILADKASSPTALLLDPDGAVGKSYNALTTPHMYIINPEGNLIYQGAIDSTPSVDAADIEESQNYVRTALDEALAGKPVTTGETKAYGCSVKY